MIWWGMEVVKAVRFRARGVRTMVTALAFLGVTIGLSACGEGDGVEGAGDDSVIVQVPRGAAFQTVVDTLEVRGLVGHPLLFRAYARLRTADREIRAGSYAFAPDASWGDVLDALTEGRVMTVALTVPEGFTLPLIAPRLAEMAGIAEDSALARMRDSSLVASLDVPGPTLEGYLFPDTYRFAAGSSLQSMLRTMVQRYRALWTPRRIELLDSMQMSEAELVTLASIVQAEARVVEEMDTIASVYHNRLQLGMRLEADPTVLYALGGHRERLLYAAMDSVADNPYNTYTSAGLPPGPIGSPGEAAIDATLQPAETDFLFFVARADGTHVFTRTLAEHNRAVAEVRRNR